MKKLRYSGPCPRRDAPRGFTLAGHYQFREN
jgi:hypothetical protein